jgi:hypothetical protein
MKGSPVRVRASALSKDLQAQAFLFRSQRRGSARGQQMGQLFVADRCSQPTCLAQPCGPYWPLEVLDVVRVRSRCAFAGLVRAFFRKATEMLPQEARDGAASNRTGKQLWGSSERCLHTLF